MCTTFLMSHSIRPLILFCILTGKKSRSPLNMIPILLLMISSCRPQPENNSTYPSQVGDIHFDSKIDDPDFKLCDENQVLQYYNFGKGLQYKGEKIKIIEHFREGFKSVAHMDESGFVTIRFIVNCQGKTGRYRLQGMNNDYIEKTFPEHITDQLLGLTKQLDGWSMGEANGKVYDYYQYLSFKMEDGKLIEIMP